MSRAPFFGFDAGGGGRFGIPELWRLMVI
jgi:hypothetical protein